MQKRTWVTLLVTGISILVVTLLVGVVIGALTHQDHHATSVAFNPDTDLVPQDARCTTDSYIPSSTLSVKAGDPNHRQFATAVSIPYKGTTDDAVSQETVNEICGNPTELKMVADDMMLWPDSLPGATANKVWIKKDILDVIDAKGGLDSFIGKDQTTGKLVMTAQFQEWAGWLNTITLYFNTEGLQNSHSVRNWELAVDHNPRQQPVAQVAQLEEHKPAWVRVMTDKLNNCLFAIGFNAEDKRLEVFNCPSTPSTVVATPKPSTPTPSVTPTPSPSCPTVGPKKLHCNDKTPVAGATPAPVDSPEPTTPAAPATPAPAVSPGVTQQSNSTAPGATPAPVPTGTPAPTVSQAPSADSGGGTPIIIP